MSAPQFVTTPASVVINSASVSRFIVNRSAVVFQFNDGNPPLSDPYPTPATAKAALKYYADLFNNVASVRVLASLPSSIPTGYPDSTIQIFGSNFSSAGPQITINGTAFVTRYVSSMELAVDITAGTLPAGSYAIVYSDGLGQSFSLPSSLVVYTAVTTVTIAGLDPSHHPDTYGGSYTGIVRVLGANFSNVAPVISVNATPMATTYVSDSILDFTYPSGTFGAGTYNVAYSDGGGGSASLLNGFTLYTPSTTTAYMQPYQNTSDTPVTGLPSEYPADVTLPAYYIGTVNHTYYLWDVVSQTSWIGIVTV